MNKIDFTEQDVPKYLKQKESNTSKSSHKSKHKHQYEECLIQYEYEFVGRKHIHTRLHGYCVICGKIGSVKNGKCETELKQLEKSSQSNNYLISISGKEVYERYHNKIPVFFVKDMFSKYVDLKQNCR